MKAIRSLLIGGSAAAVAAIGFAAPAAAQYYPGGGYNYNYGGGAGDLIVGSILNNILRGSWNGGAYQYNGFDYGPERYAVDQCSRVTEQRLNGGYGGYNRYGNWGNGGARVTQIESVQRTGKGNIRVHGWAGTPGFRGNYGGYGGYGYNGAYNGGTPDVWFNCKVDVRNGQISDLQLQRRRYGNYGYRY